MNKWIKDFPMLKNDIVYLDNAALILKPKIVIDEIYNYYTNISISNRTKDSKLGIKVDSKINETREKVATLLNCQDDEIIFTSGTTDSLNYASLLLENLLKKGDEIILSKLNHASNIVPWLELAKRTKAKIVLSLDITKSITKKTKLICISQVNNSFQARENLDVVYEMANKVGAYLVNDAAQAIAYEKVSFDNSHIIAFSTNKFYGPTGLGILAIKKEILNKCEAKRYGGGSIDFVALNNDWKSKDTIIMHEPGTMNLAGIFGFNAALDYFNSLNLTEINKYIHELSEYLFDELAKVDNLRISSKRGDSIILFYVKGIEPQDVSSYLGHNNIYVRSGIFCNQYLKYIKDKTYVRVSLSFYNTKEDIDKLTTALKRGGDFLGFL
ncbi:MAG: aminotransferase class V-fold PLP-dependent enzyme [Mycoplasmataceae bacterium]|nr:aminotransferase class V-fold PLP-dependent enzyme [Mycoplasmataceae bacterium]